jgi:hypothetical protein
MWKKVTDTVQSAAAFLQDGKVPPNTPIQYREDLSKINFFSSKKFFIVFSSIVLLMVFYLVSVGILFLTAKFPTLTDSYVIIFVESIKIFAIIISAYLGLQAAIDFKYSGANTNVSVNTNKTIEQIDQKIITEATQKYEEIYKNDPSYAPIDWALSYDK